MNSTERIQGMLLPLPTPFQGNGELDEGLLQEMARFYVKAGVNALFLLGSYGQGPAMPHEMRKRATEQVVKAVGGQVPIVVHIGAVDPYTSQELGQHAKTCGADAVALVGPYYYADRSETEIIEHIRMVDQAIAMPLFFYNNPRYQGYSVTPSFLSHIQEAVPRLFGVKLAMGTIDEALQYRTALGPEFKLFALASSLYPGLKVGLAGTVSPPLTMAPELGIALMQAVSQGEDAVAGKLQQAVIQFHAPVLRLSKTLGRAIYREGLRHIGFPVKEYPRWPTVEVPPAAREEIHNAIDLARSAAGALI